MANVFFKGTDKQNRSYDKTPGSQSTSSTFEAGFNIKELSQNSGSSRFEKMFTMSPDSDFSPLEPQHSGAKMPTNQLPQQKPMTTQFMSLEQQQTYIKQMQMQQQAAFQMRFNNGTQPMQMNMNLMNGGNKSPNANVIHNPYLQQQQNLMYQQQMLLQQQALLQQQNKQIPIINQPKPNLTLKVFEKFSGPNYDKKLWYYVDRAGKRQGPFTGKEMDDWYREGYLPNDLIVTFGEGNGFRQLIELVKNVEESLVKPPPVQVTSMGKILPGLPNLASLTSFQLSELMKNPDFVQNAKKAGYNLNQLMYTLIEREQNDKNKAYNNVSAPVITGTFDSQGVYYPVNNPAYSMGSVMVNPYAYQDGAKTDASPDSKNVKQGYTNQGYSPNVYGNNILPQNSTNLQSSTYSMPQGTQPSQPSNSQSNGGSTPDNLTNQLKSLLGMNGGLGDLIGGVNSSNKAEQGIGAQLNSNDFPPLNWKHYKRKR